MSRASTAPPGRTRRTQRILATSTFTVPPGVWELDVLAVGPGGGGGSCSSGASSVGGGGGGGWPMRMRMAVTPGEVIAAIIGSGGSPTPSNSPGVRAGQTSFRELIAPGGGGGGGVAGTSGQNGADSLASRGALGQNALAGGGGGYSGGGGGGGNATGGQHGSAGVPGPALDFIRQGGGNGGAAGVAGTFLTGPERFPFGAGGKSQLAQNIVVNGASGAANTGNGGDGGAGSSADGGSGGSGGSGVVIVTWEE